MSIGFVTHDGEIEAIEILHSTIKVTKMSYQVADSLMAKNADLASIQSVVVAHQQYRERHHAISLNLPDVTVKCRQDKVTIHPQETSPSRELVAEMMIMAGRAMAKFSIDNQIAMPYAIQDKGDFPAEILTNKNQLSWAQSFQATQYFKRSATSTKPALHYGLGLDAYLRITSPLRRYFDLLAHQQLCNFIAGRDTYSREKVQDIIGIVNATLPSVGKAIRYSNDHFKCLYLMQNPQWQGDGVVVGVYGDKALLLIAALGMTTKIKCQTPPKLNQTIVLKVAHVDLVERLASFKPV